MITIVSILIATCFAAQTYLDTSSKTGKSTFYGGNANGGACGYATVPTSSFPFGFYAACGGAVFDDGLGCGKCFEVTCVGPETVNPNCYCSSDTPSVIVSCMDQCPECTEYDGYHMDLDPTAMERIVAPGLAGLCGIISTTVRRVPCDYTGNIKIRSKSGTSAYWYGLHIDDVANYGDVSEVAIKSSGSSSYSTNCYKKSGSPSFWLCEGGFPLKQPLSMKLTNANGQSVTCNGCITSLSGGTEYDFGTNFGGGVSSPVAVPTSKPVQSPVASPTSKPVASPTSRPVATSTCSATLKIQNHADSQIWWMAIFLDDVCEDCGEVTNVQIKDNGNYRNWYSATSSTRGSRLYYSFNNKGAAFSAPLSIRITNSAGSITVSNAIRNIDTASTVDSGTNLCQSNSAYVDSADSSTIDNDAMNWTSWFAIIICSLILIGCIVGLVFYLKQRKRKKGVATFEGTAQTNEEEQEIEVEMNVNDGPTKITQNEDSD